VAMLHFMKIRYSLRFLEGCRPTSLCLLSNLHSSFFIWRLPDRKQRQKDADGDVSRN